jgi:hypothetical protein
MCVHSESLKELVVKMIKADKAVWFGCDVGKMSSTTFGVMDTKLFGQPPSSSPPALAISFFLSIDGPLLSRLRKRIRLRAPAFQVRAITDG